MGFRSVRDLILLATILVFLVAPAPGAARSADGPRTWFQRQYRYLGVPVSDGDLDLLVDRWRAATSEERSLEDRRASLEGLFEAMIEIQGLEESFPQGPPASLLSRVDDIRGLESPPDPLPEPTAAGLGTIREIGNGPTPVVLLAGEIPTEVAFAELLELADRELRIVAIDLPGIGGTPAYPLPESRDHAARPWIERIETGVLEVIRRRGLDRPLIAGHGLGAWIAFDLAGRHPGAFRSAVLVDQVRPLLLRAVATRNIGLVTADRDGRMAAADRSLPPILPPVAEEDRLRASGLLPMASSLARDEEAARRLGLALARTHPTVLGRYTDEAFSLGRRELLERLEIPMLWVLPFHDESSVLWSFSYFASVPWKQVQLDRPAAPLQIAALDDVRDPFLDEPLALGRLVADFAAGRPLDIDTSRPRSASNPPSKPRSVSAGIGTTEVRLDYWSPRARSREVWGSLVPWDTLWRAGANEATRLRVNRQIELDGARVSPGEYSLLIEPRAEGRWRWVLHQVPWLWGSGGPYDPAYDAVELEVGAEVTDRWTESLTFDLRETTTGQGELVLLWGDRRSVVRVAAPEGIQAAPIVSEERLGNLSGWIELATDPAGDSANPPVLHDGIALAAAYECATDRVWFRFDLAEPPDERLLGLNVAVDTDRDLSTGMAWWAANDAATFDRLVTLWVEGSDDTGYLGTVGVADAGAVRTGDFTALAAGELELGIDRSKNRLYLAVPSGLLDDDGEMALVATVGTSTTWNDDLLDEGQATLRVTELRDRGCRR